MNTFKRLPLEKQAYILDAAAKVFAHNGYHAASIKDICQQAGISNGALYKYFKNKEDLYLSVLERCQDLMRTALFNVEDNKGLLDVLRYYLLNIQELATQYPDYMIIYTELSSSQMKVSAYETAKNLELESNLFIQSVVQKARQNNEIQSDLDDMYIAFLIDNYFVIFLYSCISEFHHNRFDLFLTKSINQSLTSDEKIDAIIHTLQNCLLS